MSVSSFVNIKMLGTFRFNIFFSAPGFVLVFVFLFFFLRGGVFYIKSWAYFKNVLTPGLNMKNNIIYIY